jgi:hypothetical protein
MTLRTARWIGVPCLLALLGARAPGADLSGTWQVDVTRSTDAVAVLDPAGPPPPPAPPGGPWPAMSPETLTQRGRHLTIQVGVTGEVLQLTIDGQERLNPLADGHVHRSTTRWERDRLVTAWTLEQDGQVRVQGSDVRQLDEGGRVLVNDRIRSNAWMRHTFHIVWVRR